MSLLKDLKRFLLEVVFNQSSWLPRYYIVFKWGRLKKEETVLDIGCGEGIATMELGRRSGRVVALDISLTKLKQAAARKKYLGPSRKIDFVAGDILRLPFPDGYFDLAVFMDALPEIRQDAQALAEIARVMKPRGRLLITAASHYACIGTLFREQGWLRKIVPRRLYRRYLDGGKAWLDGDEDYIKKGIRICQNYTLEDLQKKAAPFFEVSRHAYILKRFAALATDITYGIKGMWHLRPFFFWPAVRLDYYLNKKDTGYSVAVEFVKKA